jgi:hypothetical protein
MPLASAMHQGERREQQKKIIKDLLSDAKTGAIYGKWKIDVERAFGLLEANLCFTRFSVRGKVNVCKYASQAALLRRKSAPRSSKRFQPPRFGDWNLFSLAYTSYIPTSGKHE